METRLKKIRKRLIVTVIITAFLLTIFTMPLLQILLGLPVAPLGNILFPGSGIWRSPGEVPASEVLNVPNLTAEVKVYRDEWGIPHIYAANEDDLSFALGYLHAQDRLFQMDMARRQVRGKLSEVVGDIALDSDKYNLAMGMEYWANQTLQSAIAAQAAGNITYLDSAYRYVDGVNYYIDTHQDEYPVEYGIIGFKPTHWSLLDTFCFAKYMAKMLTG